MSEHSGGSPALSRATDGLRGAAPARARSSRRCRDARGRGGMDRCARRRRAAVHAGAAEGTAHGVVARTLNGAWRAATVRVIAIGDAGGRRCGVCRRGRAATRVAPRTSAADAHPGSSGRPREFARVSARIGGRTRPLPRSRPAPGRGAPAARRSGLRRPPRRTRASRAGARRAKRARRSPDIAPREILAMMPERRDEPAVVSRRSGRRHRRRRPPAIGRRLPESRGAPRAANLRVRAPVVTARGAHNVGERPRTPPSRTRPHGAPLRGADLRGP
jgi:hypothetical protein